MCCFFIIFRLNKKLSTMSVLKVVEILADSTKGWEDATAVAIAKAGKSVKNIRSAYVRDQSVTVENNEVKKYRVSLKVTFEVD